MNDQLDDRPIVVGVGASAGGLDAISQLLKGLPDDSRMSFVIIQHLDPTHKSALVEILARRTSIAITQVEKDTQIEPNHIYLIPPGKYLSIENCVLRLSAPQDPRGSRMAIDYFLRSLAEDQCEYGVGVILSGTGTDGTAGLQEIKHYGGLTVVQDPEGAEHGGMPRSAIDAVHVDYVLPAERIGQQLKRYVEFCQTHGPLSAQSVAQSETFDLSPILDLLRKEIKHDFRRYRKNTLMRRIQRRMGLHQLGQLSEYKALLADNPKERESLRCDLLIGVTRFFRDSKAWEVLDKKVIRPLMEQQDRTDPIRVWSAGCATGEEAYSIAMMLHEQIAVDRRKLPFQIFATDVADDALAFARTGLYPEAIMKDVPLERLRRFFKKEPGGYRVSKQLRESVVFANQNVLAQPPFAKLDLILCRNLLIYLQREAQDRVMSVFQFALKEGGVLFQGSTETVGGASDLFAPVSKKWRIFRRTGTKSWPPAGGTLAANIQPLPEFTAASQRPRREKPGDGIGPLVQRQLMQQHDRAVVVVNQEDRVLFAEGRSDLYLQFKSGVLPAKLPNVMEVARKGLKAKLRAALRKAWKTRGEEPIQTIEARAHRDGGIHRCQIQISQLLGRPEGDPALMVTFTPLEKVVLRPSPVSDHTERQLISESKSIASEQTVMELEHELTTTRDQLQSSIADLEAANEELKASNEEAMTMNEEMQSSNEELETSKEELQSLNEQLTTLNNQLEIKVEELEDTTNDLENLLTSSDIPTVFLDTQFRIRRYTPSCAGLFRFIAGDVGRPLADITSHFDDPDLIDDAQSVLRDLQPREKLVTSSDGSHHYRRCMLPYRTEDSRIQGVVMTFADITELTEAQQEAQRQLAQKQSIYASTPVGLAFVDTQLRYVSINKRLAEINGATVEEHLGKTVRDILPKELARIKCNAYQQVLDTGEGMYEIEVAGLTRDKTEKQVYLISCVPVTDDAGEILGINTVVQDITDRKHNEEALAAQQRKLRTITDAIPPLIAFVDRDYQYQFVNARYAHEFKRPIEEFIGQKVADIVGDEHFADIQPHLQAALSGEQVTYDLTLNVPDTDEVRFKEVTYVPETDADGAVSGVHVVVNDFTERKRAEIELADREAHLRRVIDGTQGFIGVLDVNGTILEVNEPALQVIGMTRDDVVGKPFWDTYWWNFDEQNKEKLKSLVQQAAAGEAVREDVTYRIAGDVRRMVDCNLRPVMNDDGNIRYLIPSGVDITDRHAAEVALLHKQQQLRMALSAGGMAAWEWTPEGSVWEIELLDLLGQSRDEEASSEQFFKSVHPEDLPGLREAWRRATKGEDEYHHEFRVIHADGRLQWLAGIGTATHDDDGNVNRMYGLNWDITARKERERQLQEARAAAEAANDSKSAFLANMSHEIRTPMTAILGYTELMSNLVENAEAKSHLQTIRHNGDFLLGIINDILDLSKIEANKFDVDFQRFNPANVVEDVRSIMNVRATESELSLDVQYRSEIPVEIESDPKRLKQILINLVGNAIKFTKKGGVNVGVSYEDGKLVFQITDSGIGIPAKQQDRLFQPFSQGDHSVNREFGGTGLGLAISNRLATMLGGSIRVESEEGRGSTFTVSVAVGNVDGVEMAQPKLGEVPLVVATSPETIALDCRVLVVDDRRDIRFLSRRFLTDAGATVKEAEDGEVAIKTYKETSENGNAFDLILLDMQMPRLDGYATAKQLRLLGFTGPIIALTADAMQGDMSKCIEAGCNDYLSKPIDKTRLLETVFRFSQTNGTKLGLSTTPNADHGQHQGKHGRRDREYR